MATEQSRYDIILYGATGFTGRLVAEYLAGRVPVAITVALAGRSGAALNEVRTGLGEPASSWGILVADSSDPDSLSRMASSAGVVLSTVGPYSRYGLPVVEACAQAGTDYVDITGEVGFMRDSIDRFDDVARGSGARIVHACGFDSIPSDLGVWDLARRVAGDGEGHLEETTLVVTKMRGGVSGGTIASGMAEMAAAREDPGRRAALKDPYSLSPDRGGEPDLADQSDPRGTWFDGDIGQWVGPFVMAGVNTRVVRRSNALLGHAYGRRFRYREVSGLGTGPTAAAKGAALAAGLDGLAAISGTGAGAAAADRLLPKPGEGPDEQARRSGYFRMEIHARTSTGARYVERVAAQGDPGYAATCVMVGEAALCMVEDRERLPDVVGVLTPAVAFDGVLVARLQDAGMTFESERIDPSGHPGGDSADEDATPQS